MLKNKHLSRENAATAFKKLTSFEANKPGKDVFSEDAIMFLFDFFKGTGDIDPREEEHIDMLIRVWDLHMIHREGALLADLVESKKLTRLATTGLVGHAKVRAFVLALMKELARIGGESMTLTA